MQQLILKAGEGPLPFFELIQRVGTVPAITNNDTLKFLLLYQIYPCKKKKTQTIKNCTYMCKMGMDCSSSQLACHVDMADVGEGNKIDTNLALHFLELTSQLPTAKVVGHSSVLAGFDETVNLTKSRF